MAQKKKRKKGDRSKRGVVAKEEPSLFPSFFSRHPHVLPLALLFLFLLIFFNQMMFAGKTLLPPDKLTSISYEPFVKKSFQEGEYPLWFPYIFSGMPSFASLTRAPFVDILGSILKGLIWLIRVVFPLPSFTIIFLNYFLFGLFTYLLLLRKTRMRLIALFAALALVFQPSIIAFSAFGHNTKLFTALFIPVIFLLVEEVLEERKVRYGAVLALAVGMQLLRAHTQMAYYTFMMIGLFTVYWLVESVVQKRSPVRILQSMGILVTSLGVGILMSSWLYFSVLEYARYSIRGAGGGLDYSYASSWSFSPLEVLTFFVPSFVGFGGPTYWGNMPFTDFPMYMGIVPLFFAGLAFVFQRNRTVVFFGIMTLLALLISFGKEFSLVYDLLFKYLPYFNKFRVPSMILILVQFSVVVLAALALFSLWQWQQREIPSALQKKVRVYLYGFCGVAGLIFLYLLLAKGAILSRMAASGKVLAPQLQHQSYRMAFNDSILMLLFLAVTIVLLFAYMRKKIRANGFLFTIIGLTVLNLWLVDFKIIDPKPKGNKEGYFREDDIVRFLKSDTTLFRILPLRFSPNDRPDNWYAYHFLQSIYGYHPAKLKVYQEMLEETGLPNQFLLKYFKPAMRDGRRVMVPRTPGEIDPAQWRLQQNVLRMLNVKYIITSYDFSDSSYQRVYNGRKKIYQHLAMLPRAFFVDRVEQIKTKEEVFARLKSPGFDPAQTALVYEPLSGAVAPPDSHSVVVSEWRARHIRLEVDTRQPGFLVLSEPYYPAGWKATLDGRPLKVVQTNHILRGMEVPAGKHEIRFDFQPARFMIGLVITLSLLIGCLTVVAIGFRRAQK